MDVDREATVKCCGVAVAMPQGIELGSSLVERIAVNTGTVLVLPAATRPAWRVGWAHRRLIGPGRGGAAVVVGAWESHAQGEGWQRLREGRSCKCRKMRR